MKVESINHLKQLCTEGRHEYYIMLNFGLRSSKYIAYNEPDGLFEVNNEIDDTYQELTETEILNKEYTNIGEAIQKGSFFIYD